MVTDRIENKRVEKNIKVFKWGAIISLLIAVFTFFFLAGTEPGGAAPADFFIIILPVIMYFQYRKATKKWKGQYIEWTRDSLSFKSRKYEDTTILIKEIIELKIHLDYVEIFTVDKSYSINIEDYTKYEDRIRLKDNFRNLKTEIDSRNTE